MFNQRLKVLVLAWIFIFCFEGEAGFCERIFRRLTRNQVVTAPEQHSVKSTVWKISIQEVQEDINGTGFFIAPNKLITNFHVISELLDIAKTTDITLSQDGNAKTLKIKGILAVSALHDLALLETTRSVEHYLPIRKTPLQEQEELSITGYPGGKLTDIKKISNRIMFSTDMIYFFVNHFSLGGASGSPVVDAKKQVVGIFHASNDFNLVASVSLNNLRAFIQKGSKNKPKNNPKQVVQREIQNLRNLAKRGNAWAQIVLGEMYDQGFGVAQSTDRAVVWFTKAAKQGHALAQFYLGRIYISYYFGWVISQNYELAFQWFKQAADQGHTQAQFYLGRMYYEGKGVPQNFEKAAELFTKAAEKSYAKAQNALGEMYYEGKGVPQNFKKAAELFTKAAKQGHAPAQSALSKMYYEGKGVPQNFERAEELLKQAEEYEEAYAQAFRTELGL